jgi:hypothetical protein
MKKENVLKLVQRVKELKEEEKGQKSLNGKGDKTKKTSILDKIKKTLGI